LKVVVVKKKKTHCVMEPSCGWICNSAIVWWDELAVVKVLDRIKNPQFVQGLTLYLAQITLYLGLCRHWSLHSTPFSLGEGCCFRTLQCMHRTYWWVWSIYYSPGVDVVFYVGVLVLMYYCCRASWVLMAKVAQWGMVYCLHWMMVLAREYQPPSILPGYHPYLLLPSARQE